MQAMPECDVFEVGHCRHLECMAVRGGTLSSIAFPSICVLIRHPALGHVLYDTGYAPRFHDITRRFPERLYAMTTPVELPGNQCLLTQLAARGIAAQDIRHLIISHFHADHVAGLRDFPAARFIAARADVVRIGRYSRWRGVLNGFLRELLPTDFERRLGYSDGAPIVDLPRWMHPFERGHDIFGDKSVLAVPLPGHTGAQTGLLFSLDDGQPMLLAADACWSAPACRDGRLPSRLTRLIHGNWAQYRRTFAGLRDLMLRESAVRVLPSHCSSSLRQWRQRHA